MLCKNCFVCLCDGVEKNCIGGVFFIIFLLFIKMMWLVIFFVKFILWVIIIIVIFFLVSFFIICNIFLISLGFKVEVGLLNSIILGFIVRVCVMVMCCFWLFERRWGVIFVLFWRLIFWRSWFLIFCVFVFFNFFMWIGVFMMFFSEVIWGKRLKCWKIILIFLWILFKFECFGLICLFCKWILFLLYIFKKLR